MGPNLKLVLNDLGRRFDNHDAKWECWFLDHDRDPQFAIPSSTSVSLETICADMESLHVDHANVKHDDHVAATDFAT